MKNKFTVILFATLICLGSLSCDQEVKQPDKPNPPVIVENPVEPTLVGPVFDADSAFVFIEKQLSFGFRVPGTSGHGACAKWILAKMKSYSSHTLIQMGSVKAHDGKTLPIHNIIGIFNPENPDRILLSAHWDTRPWADNDPNPDNHKTPVTGANDGASGVAVLLELARNFSLKAPGIGIDLILWDTEDYGLSQSDQEDTYCLGSQFWAKSPHKADYKARFSINLDMVGANGAQFTQEGYSMQKASHIVQKVWNVARQLGYSGYFLDMPGAPVIDDHFYVGEITGIPSIDIIDRSPGTHEFPAHWHTVKDDISVISRQTLKAVGQTVMEVVYREK